MSVISLNNYSQIGLSSAGFKIKHLGLLKSKGFEVADGFAITDVLSIFAFRQDQVDDLISNLTELETVKKDDIEKMKEISHNITNIFESLQINEKYRNEIFKHYEDVFIDNEINGVSAQIRDLIATGRNKSVIIRPSVLYKNTEESLSYCFSVFDSKKEIWKGELIDMIKEVVISYFSPYALFYYQTHSIIAKEINFSILIQQYLMSDSKGSVCFKNPDSKKEEIIIETLTSESPNIKHIPPENISEFEERITEEEKAVIQIATKICSALQNKNSIIDWMIAKGRVYISNIRKLELSDDQMRGKQINAVAKNSTFFEENNILVDKKFKKNLLFLYPKAEAIVLEQEGLLSAAGELAREMKKKYMDSLVCISNNINIAKIDNKDILIENEEISFPSNSMDDAITDNFFNIENLSKTQSGNKNETCETEKQTAQMNFFSKIIIKIPFNLDEDGIAYLNKKVDRYNNIFLLEKSSVGENSQHNYFFNYSNYYSNTINAGEEQEQSTPFKKLKINQLFIDKDDEATKINQMLGENLEINHYVEFNNLKEIILFDFSNTSIPQHIFLNIKNILGELETENLSNQNIEKVAELIKKFSLKAKKSNKKIITGIVFNENGNCILKKNLFYSDYLLVENNMLEEFEKIHESIKKYEQTFMFEYIKNQCLKKEL